MLPCWPNKKKQSPVAMREPTPEEMLRIMEKKSGRFVVRSAKALEVLLTLQDDEVRQRVSHVTIESWPERWSTKRSKKKGFRTKNSKKNPTTDKSSQLPSRPTKRQLRALSQFPNLTSLQFFGHDHDAVASMLRTPHTLPPSITHLDLPRNRLGVDDADILRSEGVLPANLVHLNLASNRLHSAGASMLLRTLSSRFPRLSSLDLSHNDIGLRCEGGIAHALVPGVFPPTLTDLNLEGNWLGDEGLAALCRPNVLPEGLTRLNVARQKHTVTSVGVESLATAALPNLQDLTLANNRVGPTGVGSLVNSTFAQSLTRLDMDGCGIEMEGAGILIDNRALFQRLRILILNHNKMGGVACYSLKESFHGLEKLWLHSNEIHYHNRYGLNAEYWTEEDYEAERQLNEDRRTREEAFRQRRRLNHV